MVTGKKGYIKKSISCFLMEDFWEEIFKIILG
jgi:hypothetical protein